MASAKIKNYLICAIGLFFICFGAYAMDYAIWRGKPSWIFWICYMAMILIGFGALLKLPSLVASQLAIIGVPLVIWNIDFFYQQIFSRPLWGVTDYFFSAMLPASRLISLEHFFVIPLGFILLWLMKLNQKNFWEISVIQVAVIYFIIRFFTSPAENVNCVFRSCLTFIPNNNFYPLIWFGLIFFTIGVIAGLINLIPIFHKNNPPA